MIRTPLIVGSCLALAAWLGSHTARAQSAGPKTDTPVEAPSSAPVTPSPPSPAAAVPAARQVQVSPSTITSGGGAARANAPGQDQAAKDLAEKLEPTPGGLTADEVVEKALANSPTLARSQLEADKAAANRARAKLALAPRIDLMGSYTRLSKINPPLFDLDGDAATPPGPLFTPIYNQYMAKASASLPITDWFLTIIPTYRGAALMSDVAEEQRKAQELQVSHDARVAFYDYVHARGGEVVALVSVKVLAASVADLENLVRAGASTPTALARARAAHANAEAMAIRMHGLVEVSLERLSQLAGETIQQERGIGEPLVGFDLNAPPSIQHVSNEARANRPEVRALKALHKAREHFARARRGGVMPKLSAGGSYYYANPNPRYMPPEKEWNHTWDVGVTLSWSPNDATYAATQAGDAETDLRIVEEDLRGFEQAIAIESASAVTSYTAAAADITAKTEALEAARRYHEDQRSLMLAGAATPNDVLLAERDLTAAALEWVDAFVSARRAEASLLKAQGKTGLAKQRPVEARGSAREQNQVSGSTP